jgi:hypothetical protein
MTALALTARFLLQQLLNPTGRPHGWRQSATSTWNTIGNTRRKCSGRLLSVARLAREYALETPLRTIMRAQIGDCPNRNAQQDRERCDPYSRSGRCSAVSELDTQLSWSIILLGQDPM